MTPTTPDLREIDDCAYLVECQTGRVAALAAFSSAYGRHGTTSRARRTLSEGGDLLASLRRLRRRLGEEEAACEVAIMANHARR